MRRPAVFFDRDNTLIVGNDYLGDPEKVALVAGAAGAVAKCRAMGFAVVVVSNQSGVARGMFGEDAVVACNKRMDELLLEHNPGAVIDRHEYCPFHPDAKVPAYKQDSFLRKPKPGMILAAADAMALDLTRSWMVGDAPRDITAGKAAGCRTILIIDPTLAPSPAALEVGSVKPDYTVSTLIEAVELIAKQSNKQPPPTLEPQPPKSPTPAPPPAASTSMKMQQPPPAVAPAPASPTPMPLAAPRPTVPGVGRAPITPLAQQLDISRLELLSQQILIELKKANEAAHDDFSVSKLIAGIAQVLAVAAIMLAYFLFRSDAASLQSWLLVAVFLQTFTISLLIMSRQK
ncbi:MAG: HAD-IIIA family hydrolase [Burkholderiales bacterium]|nr:HAD-IIIA family hydrolase [Phycisphaerae bacterium]